MAADKAKWNEYVHRHKSDTKDARHWLSGTKYGQPLCEWLFTAITVLQRHALGRPPALFSLFPTFDLVSPLSLTFFIASRNVSESKIHFLILQRHKREIFMRMDTFTVYSTFDWDQLVKNSRPDTRTAGENALKLVKKISLNVICWKLPKIWLRKSRRILLSFVYLVGWANL